MLKERQRRGISLVALIITIIVLIILTGAVIINVTGDNSIINKANEAVTRNNMSMYREEFINNIMKEKLKNGGTLDANTINTRYNENAGNMEEEIARHYDIISRYVPSIKKEESKQWAIIEGNLKYTDVTNKEAFNIAAELNMQDLENLIGSKVESLKQGDYIKYTPGTGSYTAKADKTGHSEDQTYTSTSTEESWRILSINGTKVTIVRDEPLPALTLVNREGYDNAVQELNNICSIYKNNDLAKEARSIIIEDVNEITG